MCQFDQCGHGPRAPDAQELGRNPDRRGPGRGRPNRLQILFVGQA